MLAPGLGFAPTVSRNAPDIKPTARAVHRDAGVAEAMSRLSRLKHETMSPHTHRSLLTAVVLALACGLSLPTAEAQLGKRLMKAAERGATRALERQAERKTAGAVDKTVDGATSPKKKKGGRDRDAPESEEAFEVEARPARGGSADRGDGSADAGDGDGDAAGDEASAAAPAERTPFSATSKYDFETGPEISYFDDFSRVELGDFPTGYNAGGTAEVATVSTAPGKWVKLTEATGGLVLMELGDLPENFTLEFDLIADVDTKGYRYNTSVTTVFTDTPDPERDVNETWSAGDHALSFGIKRNTSNGWSTNYMKTSGRDNNRGSTAALDDIINEDTRGEPYHVAFWRQGKRVRMYVGGQKTYDQQLGWTFDKPIGSIRLYTAGAENDDFYVSNFRLAKGKPDTRSKLEKEGRLTTYGLTFASGSADLQASSAGTLKMIARVLNDNPDMRLRITGHTDADGSEASNQTLSEQRAASVKQALVKGYGVSGERLDTAGKGESEPVATGSTAADKARNRRVVLEVI